MEINLKRDVPVESYEAIMEIASFDEKYDFILPVLKLEEEGGITAEQVNTKIFIKKPDHEIGKRLLERIIYYRLIETCKGSTTKGSSAGKNYYHPTEYGQDIFQSLRNSEPIHSYKFEPLRKLGLVEKEAFHLFPNVNYKFSEQGEFLINCPWPYSPESEKDLEIFNSLEISGVLEIVDHVDGKEATRFDERISNEQSFRLTDLGRKALEEGKVPVPEKGLYVLYTTEDPLFSQKLIAYEPKPEERKKDFRKKAYNSQKNNDERGNFRETEKPGWLENLIQSLKASPKIIELAAQEGKEIQLTKIEGNVIRSNQNKKVSIGLRIKSSQSPQMEVVTAGKESGLKFTCTPQISMDILEVLKNILPERADDLIELKNEPALLVSFNEIKRNASEVNSGKKDIPVQSPEIPGFGSFSKYTLRGITLLPKTILDAVSWADCLIIDSINYYIDENSYDQLCDKIIERFSDRFEYEELKRAVMSFDEIKTKIIAEKTENPEKYWFITAPEILTLKEVR